MTPLGPNDPYRVGHYRLVAELGRGGMGRVLLAAAPDGRLVALKQVRPQFAEDDGFRARFRREVAASRKVSGAYTAAVVDADPEGPTPWLASLFVPGPSLREAVDAAGALPAEPAIRLAAGLAAALAEIHHAGLVHRDLKPSNVLLTDDGPRVIDFGIARATDTQGGTEVTHTGWLVGSPGFMSPEQAEGKPVTPASDMFSLGAVLVMACTGGNPFDGASTPQTLYNVVFAEPDLGAVPERLRGVVARCLAKDPDQRPSPAEVLAYLGDLAPTDQPWPAAVHDIIAAQRAELTHLLAAAGERHRLLGTVATLLTESVRHRALADQRPTLAVPPVSAEPPTMLSAVPPVPPPTTPPAKSPTTPPAKSPTTPPAESPTAPAAVPGATPPVVPAAESPVVPAATPPTVPAAEPVGPPLLPPPLPAAAEPPTLPQQPSPQPVEYTPASYPVTPPPGSGPPMPPPPAPMSQPWYDQPRKSNANLIIGLVAGALTLVVVACLVGGVALYDSMNNGHPSAAGTHHSPSPSPSDTYTYSPSPSPSPTARDPYTLDDESTDETPLESDQFFLDYVDSYELVASGPYSACSDAGGDATEALLRKHGCGSMLTADYLDTSHGLMASVMVIPLTNSSDAEAVKKSFNHGSEAFNELSWFCPKSGTGAHLCDSGSSPQWWAWYNAAHRYVLVALVLELDGSDTPNNTATSNLGNAIVNSIKDQMLVIL